jgi:hypothetical protein
MARGAQPHPDILILGEHPCTYLAAALLREKSSLRVLHVEHPECESRDRLVVVNPALFSLHKCLGSLRRKLNFTPIYGARFLADDAQTFNEHRGKSIMGMVGRYQELRKATIELAKESGAILQRPKAVQIHRLDETGLDVSLDGEMIHPTVLLLGCPLSKPQATLLGIGEAWEREVMHRYSMVALPSGITLEMGTRQLLPMSLDLKQSLSWAWLLPHGNSGQICVMQSLMSPRIYPPLELLEHWIQTLRAHKVIQGNGRTIKAADVCSSDLPLAGAMAHEGVANRTLLIGPGGGFYSACAEDIYPNCWSAIFAVDAVKKALKEKHLQDALQPYRHTWRTTLGDYLRGPQQNLRFLLPLIYRNKVMASRLCESILLGKSVVR